MNSQTVIAKDSRSTWTINGLSQSTNAISLNVSLFRLPIAVIAKSPAQITILTATCIWSQREESAQKRTSTTMVGKRKRKSDCATLASLKALGYTVKEFHSTRISVPSTNTTKSRHPSLTYRSQELRWPLWESQICTTLTHRLVASHNYPSGQSSPSYMEAGQLPKWLRRGKTLMGWKLNLMQ